MVFRFRITKSASNLLFSGVLFLCGCMQNNQAVMPIATNGVLDLSEWNFAKNGPVELRGEWLFWWQQFIDTEQNDGQSSVPDGVFYVPGTWQGQTRPGNASQRVNSQGYATYSLDILLPKDQTDGLGVWLTDVYSAQTMQIKGLSSKITQFKQGILGRDKDSEIPQYLNTVKSIDSSGDRLHIVWQISNFHHARGGIRKTPILGVEEQLRNALLLDQIISVALVVLLLSMAIYLFGLVTQRQEDHASFWFGVTLSITAVWLFLNSRMLQIWFSTPDLLFHDWINSLEYVALYLTMPSLTTFLYVMAPRPWFRYFTIGIWAVSLSVSLFPLTRPLIVYSFYHQYYKWIDLAAFFIGWGHLIREAVRGSQDARLSLLGYSPFVLARIHDIAKSNGLIAGAPFLAPFGLGFFVLVQSHVMARFFAATFRTNERLSRKLQEEVDRQTEKLRMQKDKLEEQQSEIIKAHDELKNIDEQKTSFFRNISHELRTPLTLILSSLQSSADQFQNNEVLNIASRNAKRLYRLVNQLLDFQKIAMARVQLKPEVLDLELFLKNIANYIGNACELRGIAFGLQVERGPIDAWLIHGQIDALEKILFNYIGNAMKYTPRGGKIQLNLSVNGQYARIGVKDTGIGIPLSEQGKLFNLFSQVNEPLVTQNQGTGLGLALVRELTQQMQGKVGVESEHGKGAEFWAEFPLISIDSDRYAIVYVESEQAAAQDFTQLLTAHKLLNHSLIVSTLDEARKTLERYPVQILIGSTSMNADLEPLFAEAQKSRPICWRVLVSNLTHNKIVQNIPAALIQASFATPLGGDFLDKIRGHLILGEERRDRPLLDLLYIDDEESMRSRFVMALSRHTLIEQYKVVGTVEEFRQILQTYQIKLVVADENLATSERGLELLSLVKRKSPDTFRVLLTAERDPGTLQTAIGEANAHYVIYKPADYPKEMKVIEDYVERSPFKRQHETVMTEDLVERNWHLADLDPEQVPAESDRASILKVPAKATVLIIDDVRDLRAILANMLEEEGYQVIHAIDGLEGLEKAKAMADSIDIIITDWMMSGLSGPELIQALHKHEVLVSIPTVLLTAKTGDDSRSEGLRFGASAYLSKPFDRMELLSIVENLLDLKKRERKISELNRFISQNVLQRFLPPALVKDLVDGKAIFDDTAKTTHVTVLFADLCHFTESSELLGPKRISRILNTFLVAMTDIIFEEGGTIDKFIGDAILVLFGAPQEMELGEQAQKACRCAMRMQEAMTGLNRQWQIEEQHSFAMRVGIHQGTAVVGSFGGQKRSDYTAIGHTVNLSSRIESSAQPGEILCSDVVRDFLPDGLWEDAGTFKLKGIDGSINLYRIRNNKMALIA